MNYGYGANIQANGIRQHYLCYGNSGKPLVIVPGITSPAITWGFVGERLGRQFQTYILDIRGRGLSSAGDELNYGIDTLAQDLTAFVNALGLHDYLLIGHSMGARIASRATARFQLSPERLVLVDPPVSGPGRRAYPSKLPWYVDSIRAALRGMDAEAMRDFCPTWTDEQLRLRAEWLHTCNEGAVVRAFNDFHDDDFHQDLGRIDARTALLVAGRGGVILPEDEKEMLSLKPDLAITRVENAGHMIPWDNEEGFYAALSRVLETRI
ncbi:alpha/beta fold hydrolase [Halomonas sp. WWR20]